MISKIKHTLLLQNKERLLYETNIRKQRFVFSLFYNEFDVGRYVSSVLKDYEIYKFFYSSYT